MNSHFFLSKMIRDYYLMLIIYADIEDKKLEKIINSYCFGGVVGYEKDHIYI